MRSSWLPVCLLLNAPVAQLHFSFFLTLTHYLLVFYVVRFFMIFLFWSMRGALSCQVAAADNIYALLLAL